MLRASVGSMKQEIIVSFEERPNRLPLPPMLLVGTLIAGYLLHRYLPIGWPPEDVTNFMRYGGGFLVAVALGLDVWTFRTLKRHNTTILPNKAASQLAVDGPFKASRNPIYLGNIVIVLGVGFIIGSRWFLFLAALLYVLLSELAIKREEQHLAAKFPKEWKAYSEKVRRWI